MQKMFTEVKDYDATVLGIPFDGGTTYRAGHPFWAAGRSQDLVRFIRRIITKWRSTFGSK